MKKGLIVILIFAVVSIFLSGSVSAIANPSAVYCQELGKEFGNYNYKITVDENGSQDGVCVIQGEQYEAWDFYKGKVGKEHSYCAKKGYDIESRDEKTVCIEKNSGKEISVSSLMNSESKSIGSAKEEEKGYVKIGAKISNDYVRIGSSQYNSSNYSYWDWRNPPNNTIYALSRFNDSANGFITPVKTQGGCGSCWDFAPVAAIESKYEINYNESRLNPDLAEEEPLSTCCMYCGDCNGGWHNAPLNYTKYTGIVDEACFPYTGSTVSCGNICSDNGSRRWTMASDYDYSAGNYLTLTANQTKQYLIDYGPVPVAINITGWNSTSYGCLASCPVDHGVLIVGYNDTGSYWILKNSWGAAWGESGYFKMLYDNCNVTNFIYYTGNITPPNFKPSISLNYPSASLTTKTSLISFNFTVANKNATNSTCDLIINNAILNSTYSASSQYPILSNNQTILSYSLSDGNYNWSIRCWEKGIGIMNSSETRALTIDMAPPAVIIISPQNITYSSRELLINITNSSDAQSAWWFNGTANLTYSQPLLYNFSEGSNTLVAYANDSLGNLNQSSVTFSIDTANPLVTINFPSSNSILNNLTLEINITVNDSNLNYTLTSAYNSANSTVASNISYISGNYRITMIIPTDGVYSINATSYDNAGHVNSSIASNVTFDSTPPILSNLNYITSANYNASGFYGFNITLDGTHKNVWYYWNNTKMTDAYNTSNVYSFNKTKVAAGNYSFYWLANDTAGNLDYTANYTFAVLQASPLLNLSFNASGMIYYSDILVENGTIVNITATASAEGNIILYINGTIVNSGINLISNITQFNLTMNATAFYNATQNYSSSTITRWINVELPNAAPRAAKISPANNTYINATATFRINATDVSLKNATLHVWNSTNSLIHTNSTNITGMFNETSWAYSLSDGAYSWNALVYDTSDNSSFADGNFTLTMDSISPAVAVSASSTSIYTDESSTITCTASDTNLNLTEIKKDGSAQNSSSSLTTITYVYAGSGGTKTISCTATDKAGNQNSSSITITTSTRPPVNPPSSGGGPTTTTQNLTAIAVNATLASETTEKISEIKANETANVTIPENLAKEGIVQIKITSLADVQNVKVNLKKLAADEIETKAPGEVYNYFNITVANINENQIANASINFEVNQTWISENNISKETIKLLRYKENWTELSTIKVSEDTEKVYFIAETPGFSLFAIAAEKNAPVVESTEQPKIKLKAWMIAGLVAAVIALIILILAAFGALKAPKKKADKILVVSAK